MVNEIRDNLAARSDFIKPVPNCWKEHPKNRSCFSFKSLATKACRLTPRLVLPLLAGYYILGYAYVNGWMAAIDQIAMKVMRDNHMGYMAIGALMPTVQWYAAWAVRVTAATLALVVYDLAERVTICACKLFANLYKKMNCSRNPGFSYA